MFQVCDGSGTSDLVFVCAIGFGDIWFGVCRFGDLVLEFAGGLTFGILNV